MRFAAGVSWTSNGVINVNGSSGSPVIFTANSGSSPGSWGSLVISGSGANNSTINYANFYYGTSINVTNASFITLQNSTISNSLYTGITYTASSGTVYNNYIDCSTAYHGIVMDNVSNVNCVRNVIKNTVMDQNGVGILYGGGSGGNVIRNDIRYFNWGIGSIWGSSPTSLYTSSDKNNRISNSYIGLMVYYNSSALFGTSPSPSDYGNNSIYSSNTYSAQVATWYTDQSATLYAYSNWWGAAPPPANYVVGSNGTFYNGSYLSSDPWSGIPLPKHGGIFASQSQAESLEDGVVLRGEGNFVDATNFFVSYLNEHPDDNRAYAELYHCYSDETAKRNNGIF